MALRKHLYRVRDATPQIVRQLHKVNRVQVLRVINIKMEVDRHHGIWTIDSIGQPPPSVPLAIGYRAILDVT